MSTTKTYSNEGLNELASTEELVVLNHIVYSGLFERIKRKSLMPENLINFGLVREYARFIVTLHMADDVLYNDDGTDIHLSPSVYIDAVWHEHILDTKSYRTMTILLGSVIDHNPDGEADSEEEKEERRGNTREAYISLFGSDPFDLPYWKKPQNKNYDIPGKTITVHTKTLTSHVTDVEVNTNWTIERFRQSVAKSYGRPADSFFLIFNGKRLDDEKTISDYNITSDIFVHLITKLLGC